MHTTPDTRLLGILQHPVGDSLIHTILSRCAESAGVDAAFHLLDAPVKEIPSVVEALRTLRAEGVYLTGRLRTAAAGVVDYLSDEAHGTGVINTIVFDGDSARGHNTEATALVELLKPHGKNFGTSSAVILGGGAMARSAAFAAIRHFRMNHVAIADRTPQQAQVLKSLFSGSKTRTKIETHELFPPDIAQLLAEARLIVNATTIGSAESLEETPITLPDIFHNRQIVVDVNYNPVKTKMLADAEEAGAATIGGAEIMLKQLRSAFAFLTEAEFPEEVARGLIEEAGRRN